MNLVYFWMPLASANESLFDVANLPSATVIPAAPEREPMTEPFTRTEIAPPAHVNSASLPPLPSAWLNRRIPGVVVVSPPSEPARLRVLIVPSASPELLQGNPLASQPVKVVLLLIVVVAPFTSPAAVPA